MTGEQFRQMMREELERLVALNETKGRDYAGEDDALRNFRQHAGELGIAPEQVWAVFASKHWDAILSAVRHVGDDGYQPSEPVEGRVLDLILYLFLFLGLQRDEDPGLVLDRMVVDRGEIVIDPEAEYVIRRRDGLFWTGSPDAPGGRWARYDEEAPRRIPGRAVEEQLRQLPGDCFPVAADAPLATEPAA